MGSLVAEKTRITASPLQARKVTFAPRLESSLNLNHHDSVIDHDASGLARQRRATRTPGDPGRPGPARVTAGQAQLIIAIALAVSLQSP